MPRQCREGAEKSAGSATTSSFRKDNAVRGGRQIRSNTSMIMHMHLHSQVTILSTLSIYLSEIIHKNITLHVYREETGGG